MDPQPSSWTTVTPGIIAGAVAIATIVLNNLFTKRRQERHEDLQAPTEYLKRLKLVNDEGDQMRDEMRAQLDWKEREISRMRRRVTELEALLDASEANVQKLEVTILENLNKRRDWERERVELTGEIEYLKGLKSKGGAA